MYREIILLKEKIKNLEEKLINNNEDNSKILLEKQNKEILNLKEENKKLKEELNNIIEKQNSQNNELKKEIKNIIQINEGLKADIHELKDSNKKQIKINEEVKKDIQEIKETKETRETTEKENIIIINSVIMKNGEFSLIKNAIEKRINKKIKSIRKLYRATIDGGDASIFHLKCDNIPNTLTIIKSKGNRRFGGFTSNTWESKKIYKDDKNAFLFSLDKNKIYSYKNDGFAILSCKNFGPCFGHDINSSISTIGITGNPILNKFLITNDNSNSYNFYGDNNVLSEEEGKFIFAEEYEVFQIIF